MNYFEKTRKRTQERLEAAARKYLPDQAAYWRAVNKIIAENKAAIYAMPDALLMRRLRECLP
jgi:hypothetical protein